MSDLPGNTSRPTAAAGNSPKKADVAAKCVGGSGGSRSLHLFKEFFWDFVVILDLRDVIFLKMFRLSNAFPPSKGHFFGESSNILGIDPGFFLKVGQNPGRALGPPTGKVGFGL